MILRKKRSSMVNLKKAIHSHWKLFIFIFCLVFIIYIFFINRKLSLDEINKHLEETERIKLRIETKVNDKSTTIKKEIKNDKEVKEIVTFLTKSIY